MTFSEAIKMGLKEDLIQGKEDIDAVIKMLNNIEVFREKVKSLNLTAEQKRIFTDMFEGK